MTTTDQWAAVAPHCPYCGGGGLIYAYPLTDACLAGMERYYAEAYNLARGADMGVHLAAIWGGGDPLAGAAGAARRLWLTARRLGLASRLRARAAADAGFAACRHVQSVCEPWPTIHLLTAP